MVGTGQSKGELYIHFGANKSELIVYETGVGCTVHAHSDDNVAYRADNADCALSANGIAQLGVTNRHFDTFQLDFAHKTWGYTSHLTRTTPSDAVRQQCQQADAQFDGELPGIE